MGGCGNTSRVPNGTGITDFDVDICLAVLDHLNVTAPAMVGFASGGHPVLRLAAQYPHRVSRLAVINSSPRFQTNGPHSDWPWGFNSTTVQHFQQLLQTQNLTTVVTELLGPALKDPCDETLVEFLKGVILDMASKYATRTFWTDMCFDNDLDLMGNITAPALFVTSSLSTVVPVDVAYRLRTLVAGEAQVVEIPSADHFVQMTQAPLVNALLDQFISPKCHLYPTAAHNGGGGVGGGTNVAMHERGATSTDVFA